jgi:hypothetical protein
MALVGGLVFQRFFEHFLVQYSQLYYIPQSHPCEFAYPGQSLGILKALIGITTLCASSHVACLPGLDEASDSNEHSTRALYRRAPELITKANQGLASIRQLSKSELRIGFKN